MGIIKWVKEHITNEVAGREDLADKKNDAVETSQGKEEPLTVDEVRQKFNIPFDRNIKLIGEPTKNRIPQIAASMDNRETIVDYGSSYTCYVCGARTSITCHVCGQAVCEVHAEYKGIWQVYMFPRKDEPIYYCKFCAGKERTEKKAEKIRDARDDLKRKFIYTEEDKELFDETFPTGRVKVGGENRKSKIWVGGHWRQKKCGA